MSFESQTISYWAITLLIISFKYIVLLLFPFYSLIQTMNERSDPVLSEFKDVQEKIEDLTVNEQNSRSKITELENLIVHFKDEMITKLEDQNTVNLSVNRMSGFDSFFKILETRVDPIDYDKRIKSLENKILNQSHQINNLKNKISQLEETICKSKAMQQQDFIELSIRFSELEDSMLESDIVHQGKIAELTERCDQMNEANRIHIEAVINGMALMKQDISYITEHLQLENFDSNTLATNPQNST